MATNGLYPGDYDRSDPAAFLNLLFVPDEVGTTIETGHFAFGQLSTAAAGSHEKLRIANFTVEKSGVVVIYLSNESTDFKEVYFDDLVIEVTQPNILHATDYYPFGLAIRERSLEREKYRFQYQGQFAEYDEETGLSNFELRMYDGMLGRWLVPDPYRQYWSSYVGMGNNPVNGVDPDGGKFQDIIRRVNGVEVERIKTDDNFDIVINEFTFPQGSPFADGATIGIYDKIFFSADQLSAVEFQLQYDKYFSKATGAIDFDPGGQLLVGELAGMAVKAISALGSSTAAKGAASAGMAGDFCA